MNKKQTAALAEQVVTFGEFTVDVRKLSPKARDALFEAVIQVMIDKGLLIQGVGEDLHISGEVVQQMAMLMTYDGDGDFNQ